MSNEATFNYEKIDNPYDQFLERSDGIIGDIELPDGSFSNSLTPNSDSDGLLPDDITGGGPPVGSPGDFGGSVISGQAFDNIWIKTWIKSTNYQPGKRGFLIGEDGSVEFNNGTFRGTLTAGELHVPDENTTANSFHVSSTGDTWWGATETDFNSDNDNANAYVLKTGVAKFQSVTIDGGSNVSFISDTVDTSAKRILKDFEFSPADYSGAFKTGDIAWNTTTGAITGGSGVILFKKGLVGANAGSTTFSIDATTGDAAFSGDITASTITGGTIQTNNITYPEVKITSSGMTVAGTATLNFIATDGSSSGYIGGQAGVGSDYDMSLYNFFGKVLTYGRYGIELLAGSAGAAISISGPGIDIDAIGPLGTDQVEVTGDINLASGYEYKINGIAIGGVSSVDSGTGLTGGPITTTGTISHLTTAGNKHIPTSGLSQQFLKYSASGTAVWSYLGATSNAETIVPTSGTANLGSTSFFWDNVYTGNVFMEDLYDRSQGYVDCHQDFRPSSNSVYDLGSSSFYWDSTYTQNIRFQTGVSTNPSSSGQIVYYDGTSKGFRGYVNGFTGSFDLTAV